MVSQTGPHLSLPAKDIIGILPSSSQVYSASLTLFSQIVAGDGWGTLSLPLAEAHPWLSVILFAIMISISLGVMNLPLGPSEGPSWTLGNGN